ncbi:MAG: T9SS type A sorting domain-containing protein [Bacteroidota bacterium]
MKKIILFSFFLLKTFAFAQSDTAHGIVGEKVELRLIVDKPDEEIVKISGQFLLSNPTVFYPEEFLKADSVVLKRENDSVYSFSFSARDTIFLKGEALAGSDSVCEISFKNVTIDGIAVSDFKGIIITESIGAPLPYIRPATLIEGFPNPASRGQEITWAYRLDKTSNVTFGFYTLLGKEILLKDLGEQTATIHTFSIIPDVNFAAGVYWVRLFTNSGEALQQMMVIP